MSFPTPIYPGVDPDENAGPQMNAVAVAFITLTFVVLILRVISRIRTNVSIGADDWLILTAAILSWGYTAAAVVEVQHNFYGQHIGKSDAYHLMEFHKGLYGLAIVYPLALTFSKLSLLALYWRIFRVTTARLPLQIVAALNIGWMLAAVFVGIFSCIPVQGFWDTTIKSRCITYPVFFTSNEAFTIALDLAVLLMPIYFIAQLQKSLSQRIFISSTFLLGLVVTAVSAVRLWQLVLAQRKPGFDPTFNELPAALWAIVEINVWIVVASIPSLRPLVMKILRDYKTYRSQHQTINSNNGSASSKDVKSRIWFKKGGSSASKDNRSALNGSEAGPARAFPSVDDYDIRVSTMGPREPGWIPLGEAHDGIAKVRLQDLQGIRVDREIKVSES